MKQKRIGFLSFSSKPSHLIVYAIGIAGLLVVLADLVFGFVPGSLIFPILALTLFMIVLHSVIDGINYKTLKALNGSLEADHEDIKR